MPYDHMRDHCQSLGTENGENWKFVLCSFVVLTDNYIDKLKKKGKEKQQQLQYRLMIFSVLIPRNREESC